MRSLILLFWIFPLFCLGQTLSPSARVSVITCGKGDQIYSLFGHTALRVNDPDQGIDRVYNYGTFDFSTPNFALKFVKGDLQYFVSVSSFNDFLYHYSYDERSVFEQVLQLSDKQEQKIFDELEQTLASDERFYTYKFIDRNCTTKVVDLLNDVLGKRTIGKVGNTEMTYREIIYPEFDGYFFEQWGTGLFFGPKVDESATQIFLPIELYQSINQAKINGKPLLAENKSWLVFETPAPPFKWYNNAFLYAGVLLLLVFWKNDAFRTVYFTLFGLLGIFFCVAGFYSFHEELQLNYNVLLVNPFLLLTAFFKMRKRYKTAMWTGLFCLFCLAMYTVYVLPKIHFLSVLPMILAHAVVLARWTIHARRASL